MLWRALVAVAVVWAGAVTSMRIALDPASPAGIADPDTGSTLAMAPLSLGNPAAAATLKTRVPTLPRDEAISPAPHLHTLRPDRGDTLSDLLVAAGVSRAETVAAIAALREVFDPRRIRPGQEITLTLDPGPAADGPGRLLALAVAPDYAHQITVTRGDDDAFRAATEKKELTRRPTRAEGTIRSSLYESALEAGVPPTVLAGMIRAFSWDVDFQRQVQPGDTFELLYERVLDDSGQAVHAGDIVFARLALSGEELAIWRFAGSDRAADYYDGAGRSVRKALLRTPIDGARLSSGFGRRTHPILGYTLMHRGIDFAAPKGTPIYAAGDGTVETAGPNGAYGNYVRVRHTSGYATAYAHMNGFARGVRRGVHVRQGDTIGYVGSTGRSTGPHLHFEVLRNGTQMNPAGVKMPAGRSLAGAELAAFQRHRAEIDRTLAALAGADRLAGGN